MKYITTLDGKEYTIEIIDEPMAAPSVDAARDDR